jgi:peptidoglycan/LPS O-acetylase OafA/YrhL
MQYVVPCAPAIIFLVIFIFLIARTFIRGKKKIYETIASLIVIVVIAYALNYICRKYSARASWYILATIIALPFLLGVVMSVALYYGYRELNEMRIKDEEKQKQMEKQMYLIN